MEERAAPPAIAPRRGRADGPSRCDVASRPLKPSGNKAAVPSRIVVVRTLPALQEHLPALEDLAAAALEPNVFYEPLMVEPAVRSFGDGKALEIVCVYRPDPGMPGRRRLTGFFPFERTSRYRGLPMSALVSFDHPHCFLGTPLVHREAPGATFGALLEWLKQRRGPSLAELPRVAADGPVYQHLVQALHARRRPIWVERSTRALFEPALDADTYLRGAISGGALKEVRRKERRLAEQGRLSWRELAPGEDARPWLEQFLRLEASGWKGQERSALACREEQRAFFESSALAAHARGRLMLLGLFLDARPLALKCNFLAGDGGFAFKIAFDERYAGFSPGFLLEIDNVRRLHQRRLHWMDSCAEAEHAMINRLWPGRRIMATVLFATGRAPGTQLVSLMPLLKWGRQRLLRGWRPGARTQRREGRVES
jgi:CelD/BcsL family acetyltransferase involved in cellulose biosynthesis